MYNRLFFMWIPKTGGSTVHNAFLRMCKRRHIGKSWTKLPGLDDLYFGDSDYIVGHWPASVLDVLPEGTISTTILRDPIDRVISHYNYVHQHGYHYDPEFTHWVKNATFREWLDSDYSKYAANNLQTRFFCDRLIDDLDWAKESLQRFDIVGYLGSHEQILGAINLALMKWRRHLISEIDQHNQSEKTVTIDMLSDEMLAELEDRNAKDIELTDMIKDVAF